MSGFIDYYDVLRIPFNASIEEIKKAYQQIAKSCHPDMTKDLSEEARKQKEKEFILGTEAYKTLKDKEKRATYDAKYQCYQQRQKRDSVKQEQKNSEETPFWEQPNWGGYRRENRYDDSDNNPAEENDYTEQSEEETYYQGVSDIIKEIFHDLINVYRDVKSEEEKLSSARAKRYHNAFKCNNDASFLTKSIAVFGSEILYSAEKLKLKRNDDVSHYIIRNRGKALVAVGLVLSIATGMFTSKEASTPDLKISEDQTIESMTIEEPTLTIKRTYTVGAGDTLSGLAEEANCTRQEIKSLNDMNGDMLYYKDVITIPYHIPTDEIGRYTTVELYNGTNLYDFAEVYETDPESLRKLNPDTIIEKNGSYRVKSETVVIPTFTPYDYNTSKTR